MTKQNSTHIVFVLDRSGSMDSVANDVVGAYESFITEQKKAPGEVTFTLAQFDDKYELVHDGVPLSKVSEKLDFLPRGMTALFDAIGKTINTVGEKLSKTKEEERPSQILFVIQTDGEENSSKEFNNNQIKDMIKHQTEKYQWQFVFLGADQDAFTNAKNIGISASNSLKYGTRSTSGILGSALNTATLRYRSADTATVNKFFVQKDIQGLDAELSDED